MLRLNMFFLFCLVLVVGSPNQFLHGQSASDKSKEKGPAFTEPPKDDWTYALTGEYLGTVKSDKKNSGLLGLQIRAIGDDQFDAVAYLGGLPGQKKHQPDPIRMIGRRSGEFVVLSGGPWAVMVEKNACRLIDLKGKKVGQLKRIKRKSPTLYANPPEGATVLFNGTGTDQFVNAEMTDEGLLMEGADVKPLFQDFNLHIEFRLPYMPQADDQQRANSGLYLQSRYECQVLDSFAQTPKINGCGALYRFKAPDLNMCFPPLVWQTYDVQFTAPRWSADGKKIRNAHITSWINGTKVQDNVSLPNKTGAGKPEGPMLSPMKFQNHGDPVRFRNVWVVDRGLATGEFPIIPNKEQIQKAVRAQQQRNQQLAREAKKREAAARQEAAARKEVAALRAKIEKLYSELEKVGNSKDTAKPVEKMNAVQDDEKAIKSTHEKKKNPLSDNDQKQPKAKSSTDTKPLTDENPLVDEAKLLGGQ